MEVFPLAVIPAGRNDRRKQDHYKCKSFLHFILFYALKVIKKASPQRDALKDENAYT